MSYLVIEKLNKKFNDTVILNNINLNINQGDFICILGPSGCGKSTLLRCIAGLEAIEDGKIYLDNIDIVKLKPAKRNIGMIFQQYSLFPTKTVFNNIAFGLQVRKEKREIISSRVNDLLKIIDLGGYEDKYPSQLSGGEQQRVALARSLIIEPKIILFDEPLSAIDAKLRKDLQVKIKDIHKQLKMTSIFVTHDQEEAMLLGDVIYLMNNGKIEQSGSPRDLYYNPKSLFVAQFIGDHNIISKGDCLKYFNFEIENDYLVISPENISLDKNFKNEVVIEGIIKEIIFLGDYLRILVNCQGVTLKCNLMDYDFNNLEKDDLINLHINLDSCISINK